jgi:hypothetical protein
MPWPDQIEMKMKKVFLLLLTTFFACKCFSQLEGNVVDSAGKAIAGATIVAVDSATLLTDSVNCDNTGYYAFKKLKPGNYMVTAKAAMYQDSVIKNVLVKREFKEKKTSDISDAEWLEIVLLPLKKQK